MASVMKSRCSRGLMMKEPAVGFMHDTYCVLLMFFCVSLARSNQCPQPRCCRMWLMGMAVSYGSSLGMLRSSTK